MDVTYLDNNATTRVDPRVIDAMTPYFGEFYGNPSSTHHFGAQVQGAVEDARGSVARLVGARDSEIVFTCGGTEADNAALRGVLAAQPDKKHLIISTVEHHAVLETAEALEKNGIAVTRVPVNDSGQLDLEALERGIRDDTALISIMLANNETGVIFPVQQVVEIASKRGVPVHTDAVNALGKTPVDIEALGVSLASLSAHKVYGPKGVGALYLRRGTPFRAQQIGGSQERRRRGGTLNAPGIIGFGRACALLADESAGQCETARTLRDRLESELPSRCPSVRVIGTAADRLPNTSCLCFEGLASEPIVLLLSEAGICVSSGAACSSGSIEPSHVLTAMAIPPHVAQGQVRVSFGRFNTQQDLDRLLDVLPSVIAKVRASGVG